MNFHMRKCPTLNEFLELHEVSNDEYKNGATDFENWRRNQLNARQRCAHCNDITYDQYIVKDDVWLQVMPDKTGLLHIACLGQKLGRKIHPNDLKQGLPINAIFFTLLDGLLSNGLLSNAP